MSPRVLIWRRRTESSRRMVVCLTFFAFLSGFASPALGACSVPGPAGAAPAAGCAGAARSAAFASASRRSRSCFSRSSLAWISESCCWRFCSSSRSLSSRGSGPAAGGAAGGGGGGGISAAVAAAASSLGSRLTKTRFLRTSTWIVRALPVASDFLISLVCLRVSVILFFGSIEPCDLRRYSSSLALSCSESESSATRFSTPAARSCSSSTDGGTFSSLANWATLVCAMLERLLALRGFGLAREPVRARGHDELLRLLLVHPGQLRELVHGQVREIVARLDAALGKLACERLVHALELQQLRVDAFDGLFARDRLHEQRVAGAAAQLVHRVLVECVDLHHLVDRHVGDFLEGREAFLAEDVGDFLVDIELFHEELLDAGRLLGLLLGGLFLGHEVDGPAGELGGEPHVLAAAADG